MPVVQTFFSIELDSVLSHGSGADMQRGDVASSETARLEALRDYEVLDTPPEDAFDQIAQLATQLCGVPIGIIGFIDGQRQWLKASVGVEAREIDRAAALCEQVLQSGGQPLLVPDMLQHPQFAAHPLVLGAPYVRFFACIPLVNDQGFVLGTLAVT